MPGPKVSVPLYTYQSRQNMEMIGGGRGEASYTSLLYTVHGVS